MTENEILWLWGATLFLAGFLLGRVWAGWAIGNYWAGKADTGISMFWRGRFYRVEREKPEADIAAWNQRGEEL